MILKNVKIVLNKLIVRESLVFKLKKKHITFFFNLTTNKIYQLDFVTPGNKQLWAISRKT